MCGITIGHVLAMMNECYMLYMHSNIFTHPYDFGNNNCSLGKTGNGNSDGN